MIYDIAGIMTEIDPKYDLCLSRCEKYPAPKDAEADFSLSRDSEIYSNWLINNSRTDSAASEYMFFGDYFYRFAITERSFMLHSSAVSYDGRAVLFSAPSGLGKSTHTRHWLAEFPDKTFIINDDKPLISIRDNGIFASGTPFSGKNDISANATLPIEAVCFLCRSDENRMESISPAEGFRLMWLQTVRNMNRNMSAKMLELVKFCAENTRMFVFGCTDSPESAHFSRDRIFGDHEK